MLGDQVLLGRVEGMSYRVSGVVILDGRSGLRDRHI